MPGALPGIRHGGEGGAIARFWGRSLQPPNTSGGLGAKPPAEGS